jgi:hypothetical protein
MMRRIWIALAIGITLACLVGCQKSYATKDDYLVRRAQELATTPAKATDFELADGSKWTRWDLASGQVMADLLGADNANVSVRETVQFDASGDADQWVKEQNELGQPAKLTIDAWRKQRQAELNASTGKWVANIERGHLYAWTMPDGTITLDTLHSEANGGVEVDEPKTYATTAEMEADLPPMRDNLKDYLAKRAQEVGGTLDWGENRRSWQLYGFKLPSGTYTVDVVRSEMDNFIGVLRDRDLPFATLNQAAEWLAGQARDKNAAWAGAVQYGRMGYVLIGLVLLIIFFVLFNIARSKKGKGSSIRRISGLDQIDEAVGRATEIARPVLMVPGLGTLSGITVQALTVFAYVIRTAARFGTPIRLLNADASVYAVAQEIARDVYMSEGVPEQYDPTSVRFVSDRQFAFAAGVAGTIQREKVAATFFMGDFFAESMIFAENANMVGAIQVAATTQFTQTPFFIAACDYVLLGDEFYAASAYLGRQPVLVGSLIGVDWSKMLAMAAVLLGVIVHSVQMTKPFDTTTLPPETRELWTKSNQQYLDWRKDELFFKRLTKMKRG